MPINEFFAVVTAFASGFSAPALQPSAVPLATTISVQAEAFESATLDKVAAVVAAQLRAQDARRSEVERLRLEQTAVTGLDRAFDVDAPADPFAVLVVAEPAVFRL